MKTYKYLSSNVIQWHEQHSADSYSTGNTIKGQTRTRINEQGEEEAYSPWDELLASGAVIEPQDIEPIRQEALSRINQERDALIHGGLIHNGNTFQTDQQSILDLMGAVIAGVTTQWLTADNTVVSMEPADLQALGQALAGHKTNLVYQARQHKDAILAAVTISEIEQYMNNLNWS